MSYVFLLITLGLWVKGRKTTGRYLSHHDLTTVDVNPDYLAEVIFVRLLHYKVTLASLSIICSLLGSHFAQSTLNEWDLQFMSLKEDMYIHYLEISWEHCLFSH